jgi:hypothetical protein
MGEDLGKIQWQALAWLLSTAILPAASVGIGVVGGNVGAGDCAGGNAGSGDIILH